MLPLSSIRSDLSEVVQDLPIQCVLKGVTFTATASDFSENRSVEVEGVLFSVSQTLVADVLRLANVPGGVEGVRSNDEITVDGNRRRILNTSLHQDGIGIEINLKPYHQ